MGEAAVSSEIRTIAVIGAGRMGRGIAHAAALGGFRTILEDILPTSLQRAQNEIRGHLDEAVQSGQMTRDVAQAALARVEYASSLEGAARQADLIIEAVPEEFDSKEEIFRLLDKICVPGVYLATNVANIPVSDIAAVTLRGPSIVGMRFAHPVHEMKLIEIVRGRDTADNAVAAALEVAHRMGKKTVLVNEAG